MSHNSEKSLETLTTVELQNPDLSLNIMLGNTDFDLFGVPIKRDIPAFKLDSQPALKPVPEPRRNRIEEKRRMPAIAQIVNIRPSYTTVYGERQDGGRTGRFMDNIKNLGRAGASQQSDKTGKSISKKAKLNIRCATDWLLSAAREKTIVRQSDNSSFKFKVNFITLTLSSKQVHTDGEIKSVVLGSFLDACRKKCNLKNYIWKAEPQKNGNIHFHLLTDVFIHLRTVRKMWNDSQEKLGYVSRYAATHKHCDEPYNPNSTDIHSVKKIKKLAAYLSKYLTKDSDVRKIKGRQWFLSESLQGIKSLKMYASDVDEEFRKIYSGVLPAMKKTFDYCTLLLVSAETYLLNGCHKIAKKIFDFLEPLRMPDEKEIIHIV